MITNKNVIGLNWTRERILPLVNKSLTLINLNKSLDSTEQERDQIIPEQVININQPELVLGLNWTKERILPEQVPGLLWMRWRIVGIYPYEVEDNQLGFQLKALWCVGRFRWGLSCHCYLQKQSNINQTILIHVITTFYSTDSYHLNHVKISNRYKYLITQDILIFFLYMQSDFWSTARQSII